MITIKEIEKAVTELSPEQLAEFRAWYEEFDAALWDRQLEVDETSGKLDRCGKGGCRLSEREKQRRFDQGSSPPEMSFLRANLSGCRQGANRECSMKTFLENSASETSNMP